MENKYYFSFISLFKFISNMFKYLKLKFHNFSIGTKVNLMVSLFFLSFIMMGGNNYFFVNKIKSSNNFSSVLQANSAILQRMIYFDEQLGSTFYKSILAFQKDNKDEYKDELQNIADKLQQMTDRLVSSNLSFIEEAIINSITRVTKEVIDLTTKNLSTLYQGQVDKVAIENIIQIFETKNNALSDLHLEIRDIMYTQTSGIGASIIDQINFSNQIMIICFGIVIIFFIPLIIIVRRSIMGPLAQVSKDLEELNQGNSALSLIETKNELVRIMHLLTSYKDKEIKINKTLLERDEKEAKVKKLEEFISEFKGNSAEIIEELASEAENLKKIAESAINIANHLFEDANAVSTNSNSIKTNVKTLADNSEQISKGVEKVNNQISSSINVINSAIEKSKDASSHMVALDDSTKKIGEITSMISGIAGKIKLLALNATIESARAGDAGRGFAIVASEVKALSLQTSKEIEHIAKQISDVQNNSEILTKSIEDISSSINEMDKIEKTISAAAAEQAKNSQEISNNSLTSYQHTVDVLAIIENFVKSANEVKENSDYLFKAVSVFTEQSKKINNEIEAFLSNIRSS